MPSQRDKKNTAGRDRHWLLRLVQYFMTTEITVMFKLQERHEFFKRLQGEEKFANTVEEWTPLFIEHAEKIGTTEILEVAISMGKLLSSAGHDPNEMFAVAVELLERGFSLNDKR